MTRKKIDLSMNPLLGGPSFNDRTKSGSPYRELSLSEIDVDPDQPRRVFSEDSLKDLSESIKAHGVLNPILVRLGAGGSYRLVAGERRFRASKLAGLESIPAVIDSGDTESSNVLAKQLVENIQREDLSSMEKALAIGQLRDQFSISIREIATQLGISKSSVQRSLEVLSLPEDLQQALISGAAESKILLIAEVEDKKKRQELIADLDSYTREELKKKVSEIKAGKQILSHSGTASSLEKLSVEDKRIVSEIQRAVGTKVNMIRRGSGGKLSIDFYSDDELSDIFNKLVN